MSFWFSFWYMWHSVLCTGNSTWQDYFHAKSNRQTAIVRRKYCQMWSQLSWLAGWRIFCSNMNHMPLRWQLFQLKLEGVDESPILPSCYGDIRDNHGYQLRLKKIACLIFKGWLAHTGCRERQNWMTTKYECSKSENYCSGMTSFWTTWTMRWNDIFVKTFKQDKTENAENSFILYIKDLWERRFITQSWAYVRTSNL